jgi:simple sugar transport system permease protein
VSVYLCLLLALCVWFLLFKTRTGLRIRAVGEHPKAAATLGIGVLRLRYFCVVLSGIFAALGGAVIPLSTVSYFFPSIISGQGFIAIAAVIFGKYRPGNTVLACLLFGFCKSLSLSLGNPKFALSVSGHLLSMIPYIITLLVLLFIGKSHAPAASGKIYDPAGH